MEAEVCNERVEWVPRGCSHRLCLMLAAILAAATVLVAMAPRLDMMSAEAKQG